MNALADKKLTESELSAAIASTAEGYSFPTNLDLDPPTNGLAPETQAALFHRALKDSMSEDQFGAALDHMKSKQRA